MAASVYMCEKADICRLFALFYHALGSHCVSRVPQSSRSCIVPPTLIQFLIAFLFLGKFQLLFPSMEAYLCISMRARREYDT